MVSGFRPRWVLGILLSSLSLASSAWAQDAGTPVLTKPPELLRSTEPKYPEAAERDHLTGDVTLDIDIDAEGKVSSVSVVTAAGNGFDEAALTAVKQFLFSPAEMNGKPSPVRIRYTQHFVYREPVPESAPDAGPELVTLQGHLLERGNRKPVAGAAVQPRDVEEPAISDAHGDFVLHLPAGNVHLSVRDPDYLPFETNEVFRSRERLEVTYFLMPKAFGLYETIVRADREKKEVTRYTLQREELEKVPGSFGDPLRVIQDLPGVARVPLLGGQLIIRGANPADTGTYLDGIQLPLLYHFGNGPSVLNEEFLDRLDFFPGGFGAEYGRAIGGIVDVFTRNGDPNQWRGSAKVDLIDTGVYISAPLGDGLSVSAAARRSYWDAWLPLVLNVVSPGGVVATPRYYDYQLRADWHPPGSKNSFRIFGFGSDDDVHVSTGSAVAAGTINLIDHIAFQRLVASWVFHDGGFTASTSPYVGTNLNNFGVDIFNVNQKDTVGGWREKLEYVFGPLFTLRLGADIALTYSGLTSEQPPPRADYRPFPGESPSGDLQSVTTNFNIQDYGEWIEGQVSLPWGLKIFPGLRTDEYRVRGQSRSAVDPRLTVRQEVPWGLGAAVKASVGLYHEAPPGQDLDPIVGNPALPLQAALQTSLGVEHKFTDAINLDVTGFYARRFNLAEATADVITNPDGSVNRLHFDGSGVGRAYGIEVFLKHEITKHFFGWIAYTLSWSELHTKDENTYHYSNFDQRHILTLIAQYKFGNGWELGGRFRLVTGSPYTPTDGSTLEADTQSYTPINGTINSAREPVFNQLDLRVDKTWLLDRFTIGIYLDIQNVYNANNQDFVVNDYRFQTTTSISDIPFLPTVGVKANF